MNTKRSVVAQYRFIKSITGEQILIAKILITVSVLMFTVFPPLVRLLDSMVTAIRMQFAAPKVWAVLKEKSVV